MNELLSFYRKYYIIKLYSEDHPNSYTPDLISQLSSFTKRITKVDDSSWQVDIIIDNIFHRSVIIDNLQMITLISVLMGTRLVSSLDGPSFGQYDVRLITESTITFLRSANTWELSIECVGKKSSL